MVYPQPAAKTAISTADAILNQRSCRSLRPARSKRERGTCRRGGSWGSKANSIWQRTVKGSGHKLGHVACTWGRVLNRVEQMGLGRGLLAGFGAAKLGGGC